MPGRDSVSRNFLAVMRRHRVDDRTDVLQRDDVARMISRARDCVRMTIARNEIRVDA